MSKMVKELRVFLSSPGDVAAERKAASEVLERLKKEPAFRGKIAIDVVAWDTRGAPPLEAPLSPQEAINQGLPLPSDCDIVIIILWSRMGTPLPPQYTKADGSYFKSGTEWEFENAVTSYREKNCPVILLYRRIRPVQFNSEDPQLPEKCNQLVLLKSFFDSLTNETGCNQYNSISDFKERLASDLRHVLMRFITEGGPCGTRAQRSRHTLPSRDYGELLGRKADIARVVLGLKSTAPVISIEGFPGVGKTSLALEVAYSCLIRDDNANADTVTFDYIVWVSAKGKPEQQHWLDELLNEIARVMDYSAITQIPKGQKKIHKIDGLLRTHRVLVVIDNFDAIEDQALMSWILDTPEQSKVLITSRSRQFQNLPPVDIEGLATAEALKLIRRRAQDFGLHFVTAKSDEELIPLIENTAGNPLAIVLTLGIIKGGTLNLEQVITGLRTNYKNRDINKVFQHLFSESWRLISEDAQKVLLTVPLFVGASSIRKDALREASGVSEDEFDRALAQLVGFKLLQVDSSGTRYQLDFNLMRYIVHPLTHTFARVKLDERADFEQETRTRWSEYFLRYVGGNIVRDTPAVPYWNALVSDNMDAIDAEWSSIYEVLKWADKHGKNQLLLNLVMLLVHYMDSRFLNLERVEYIIKAIKIAASMGHTEEEALLRLDALGWTYVEEGRLEEAYEQIMMGRDIVERHQSEITTANDLIALSFAWRARVRIEQGQSEDANRFIDHALGSKCSPWITSRVHMAAGDIALKQNRSKDALRFYKKAAESIEKYGGEGHGYQIDPRIGLAHLAVGNLDDARKRFNALRANEAIPIGKLYGDYGIAMVAYKENRKEKALQLARETLNSLSRRTSSNLLLKLTNQLFQDLNPAQETDASLPQKRSMTSSSA